STSASTLGGRTTVRFPTSTLTLMVTSCCAKSTLVRSSVASPVSSRYRLSIWFTLIGTQTCAGCGTLGFQWLGTPPAPPHRPQPERQEDARAGQPACPAAPGTHEPGRRDPAERENRVRRAADAVAGDVEHQQPTQQSQHRGQRDPAELRPGLARLRRERGRW